MPFKIKAKNQLELQRCQSERQKDTWQGPKLLSRGMMRKLKGNNPSYIVDKGNWQIYNQNICHRGETPCHLNF